MLVKPFGGLLDSKAVLDRRPDCCQPTQSAVGFPLSPVAVVASLFR